jgi:hypothetical protein
MPKMKSVTYLVAMQKKDLTHKLVIVFHIIFRIYPFAFKCLWTCNLTFSHSGDVNPHDIVREGLRSSHMSGEGLSVISHITAGAYV